MVARRLLSRAPAGAPIKRSSTEEEIYVASQWKLMWRKFRRHTLGLIGIGVLVVLYAIALFSQLLASSPTADRSDYLLMAPTQVHLRDESGALSRPYVYGMKSEVDSKEFKRYYVPDPSKKYYVNFFTHGEAYQFLGVIPTDLHLFGVEKGGVIFILGTDNLGRDLYSRLCYASSISLSVGLIGVALSFILGCILGGISGYRGGMVDLVIQRVIEFINGIPTIPLWMALSAAVPQTWSQLQVYVAITIILSLAGWTGLARIIRGKLLQLREEDYVMAAQIAGASDFRIIVRHLLPSFLSYLIVSITLAIPGMILGETALSFLGLGLRPPTVSWGVLLQDAQNIRTVAQNPWLMWPVALVILTVLAFNFVGDALRDAADPYAVRQ